MRKLLSSAFLVVYSGAQLAEKVYLLDCRNNYMYILEQETAEQFKMCISLIQLGRHDNESFAVFDEIGVFVNE